MGAGRAVTRSRIPHPERGGAGQPQSHRQPGSRREMEQARRSACAGDSESPAGPAVPAEPGQPAHQREPGLRHGAPGGAGLSLLADRGALRRHHPPQRIGADTGLPLFRADSRGEPAVRRISQRDAVLRVPEQHRRTAAAAGLPQLRQGVGPARVPPADGGELARCPSWPRPSATLGRASGPSTSARRSWSSPPRTRRPW